MAEDQNFDDTTLAVARRRHTRHLIGTFALAFAVVTVLRVLQDSRGGPIDPADLKTLVLRNALAMGLAFLIFLGLRRTGIARFQPPPAMALDTAQRRAARRALWFGGAVDPAHRGATLEVARHLLRERVGMWFLLVAGVILTWAGATEVGPARWCYAVIAVLSLGSAGWQVVARRRAAAIVRESEDEPR